ncbi:hypothetical protein C4573_00605 [Candidatus Woesearchaeota archaeon]|nr:MAG: hypothetical protein C4573_00605 [Candidatus Woesearchaeota archaeon]
MDVIQAIKQRRSCRKYMEKPVEFEKVSMVIEAGHHAPSAGNLQSWKFIIITEKEIIKHIANYAFQQFWIETAPVVIAVCSYDEKQERHYGEVGKTLYATQGCAAAIQNMLLTATALDLGCCWVGGFERDKVHDLLKIPTNVNLQALITLGYADEKPAEKTMADLYTCVYFNSYGASIAKMHMVLGNYSIEWEKKIEENKSKLHKIFGKIKEKVKKK